MKLCGLAGFIVWSVISAGRAETVTNNLDVQGGFVYNHGAVNPGDIGLNFTNEGVRDVTVSAGQLSGVDPETGAVITNAANLLPLRVQSLDSAADVNAAGNVVAGGLFIGDGGGLTNLPTQAFDARYLQQSGGTITGTLTVNGILIGNGSGITNLSVRSVTDLEAVITNQSADAVLKADQNQPGGFAGLDENGQLEAGVIPDITVLFSGGRRE